MDKRIISAFTIITCLLFTVSTATIDVSKPSKESTPVADSNDVVFTVLSTENRVSPLDKTTANERLPESANTQTFNVRSIEPSIPIQRHFFDRSTRIPLRFVRRHPCRKFKKMLVNQNMRSYGNDMILSDKVTSIDLEAGDRIPTKWLEFKHKYGHRHHHYHHDRDEMMMNSVSDHHKEKKREHKGGFMRRVRKFLKHTFD